MAKYHTTVTGEMWDMLSYRYYGSEHLFPVLIDANPDYADVIVFSAGVKLVIPDVDTTETAPVPPWSEA